MRKSFGLYLTPPPGQEETNTRNQRTTTEPSFASGRKDFLLDVNLIFLWHRDGPQGSSRLRERQIWFAFCFLPL